MQHNIQKIQEIHKSSKLFFQGQLSFHVDRPPTGKILFPFGQRTPLNLSNSNLSFSRIWIFKADTA